MSGNLNTGGVLSYSIRKADEKDIEIILQELKSFSDAYGTKMPMFRDYETSKAIVKTYLKDHVFFVAIKRDLADLSEKVVGFITGLLSPHIYNPSIKVMTEAFWWMNPEHRRSGAGLMLLDKYIEWGQKNVDWIIMAIEDDTPIDEKIFLDRGFRLKEKSYLMEVR